MTHIIKESTSSQSPRSKLEIVLKCDSVGSVEAVIPAILHAAPSAVDINIIHSGIGGITKSDILMAETGSRLITGFQVDILPGLDRDLKTHNVEVRLYDVIYKLIADVRNIAESIIPSAPEEEIIGSAKVIALFKSSRRGIIIGCAVLKGYLSLHHHFRIISAMGPVYSGAIESMHIEKNAVQKATPGQKVGIKIRDFNKAKIGDFVETFRPLSPKKSPAWQPKGEVIRKFQ